MIVALFEVHCPGGVAEQYQACGDAHTAGPFMSAGSAHEWRDQFCPDGTLDIYNTDDTDRCQDAPLMSHGGEWVR